GGLGAPPSGESAGARKGQRAVHELDHDNADGGLRWKATGSFSREQWITSRTALLAKEKEFTRARDLLSQQRRDLPWVHVDKPYVFDGPDGKVTLGGLFAGRSQLIVYHFMFAPDWEEGCKSCSFWADNFERSIVHLTAP